jgi:hypothetical protein
MLKFSKNNVFEEKISMKEKKKSLEYSQIYIFFQNGIFKFN